MTTNSRTLRRPRILLGVTGSVAAIKAPEIALKLVHELNAHVKVLLTRGGDNFWSKANDYDPLNWQLLQEELKQESNKEVRIWVHAPDEEWKSWNVLGDQVLHIDLRDWADIILIAPLSAHTLAKISNGFCDDTLSCVLRAWDLGHGTQRPGKPCIVAPAMNTAMYHHPVTSAQLNTLATFWKDTKKFVIVPPVVKTLACGEVGTGALAGSDEIVATVKEQIVALWNETNTNV